MDKKALLSAALIAAVGVVTSGPPVAASSCVAQRISITQISAECGSCGCDAGCNTSCAGGNLFKKDSSNLSPAGICEKL